MNPNSKTPDAYIASLPDDRRVPMQKLRNCLTKNLPEGFQETISYGMIGYVVPHRIYPSGYHVNPKLPLPFINIASQKNHIALYHSGIYADHKLMDWFVFEYSKHVITKLDMGKSCIRFKKTTQIPYELLAELASKVTPQEWIATYEKVIKKDKKSS